MAVKYPWIYISIQYLINCGTRQTLYRNGDNQPTREFYASHGKPASSPWIADHAHGPCHSLGSLLHILLFKIHYTNNSASASRFPHDSLNLSCFWPNFSYISHDVVSPTHLTRFDIIVIINVDEEYKLGNLKLEVCHPRCVCENWKGYVVKHSYVN